MSALTIRTIACIAMLVDHIGYQYNIIWMRFIGRIAFPLFVFLIINGYKYTSNRVRYCVRLAVFAALSQYPFMLFCGYNGFFDNFNVFVTLLLALLCVWATDTLLKRKATVYIAWLPTALLFVCYYLKLINSDYGMRGIFLALVLRYCSKKPLMMLAGMTVSMYYDVILSWIKTLALLCAGNEAAFNIPGDWQAIQLCALLAVPIMLVYNEKRGYAPAGRIQAKLMQLGFYAFYPVHMLLLYLL